MTLAGGDGSNQFGPLEMLSSGVLRERFGRLPPSNGSRCRHYAARRSASSTILRAGPLIRALRICWRVIRPRSMPCLSA
jgi:hypothetical protein